MYTMLPIYVVQAVGQIISNNNILSPLWNRMKSLRQTSKFKIAMLLIIIPKLIIINPDWKMDHLGGLLACIDINVSGYT